MEKKDTREKNLEDTENVCLLGAQQKFTILTQSDKKKIGCHGQFLGSDWLNPKTIIGICYFSIKHAELRSKRKDLVSSEPG